MASISIPELLRDRLGPEGAHALVELLNQAGRGTRDQVVTLAEERFARRLAEELRGVETRFGRRLSEELRKVWQAMADLETRLTGRMAALETRVIRWMFVFWAGQIGILFAFFRT